ncbi:MAG: hypothetical protein AAF604_21355 [Acidobacteriota bacterium]
MKPKILVSGILFLLLVISLGVPASAHEADTDVPEAVTTAAAQATPEVSQEIMAIAEPASDTEPLFFMEPQLTSATPLFDEHGFIFQLCSSQAQCEAICAPFGGFCWRQFCICD